MTETPTDQELRNYFWRFRSTDETPNLFRNRYRDDVQLIVSPDFTVWTAIHEGRVVLQAPAAVFHGLFSVHFSEFMHMTAECN